MLYYSSESPLKHPKFFCKQALTDLVGSLDTAYRLFRRNLAMKYRYSSLGLIWAVVPALIISLVMTIGQRAKLSALNGGSVPPQFYAVFGLFMAQTFVEALNTQRLVFAGNSLQLSRSRMPIEGILLAGFAENCFGLVVKIPVLAGVFLFCHVCLAPTWFFGLLGFGIVLLAGTAVGILLAPINALRDDIENIMLFFPWVLFAATPVFIAPKPGSMVARVYHLNPLTPLFNVTRAATYGVWPAARQHEFLPFFATGLVAAFVFVGIAWVVCRVSRPYIVERYLL